MSIEAGDVHNNEKKSIPIGETLNEAARGSVEKMLAQSSSKKVFTIRSDTKALSSRYYANSFVMSSSTELIQPELAQLAKANGLDAIIVIAEVFDRDQGRDGVRIFLRAGLNDIRSASIQPDVVLHVVDKSGTDIASDYVQPDGSLAKRANDKPWDYRLDANLDQATQAKMLAEMKASVSESVSAKMVRLGF